MTITFNTDPIVASASLAYMLPKALISNKMTAVKDARQSKKYERKIRQSQKKLEQTKLVPGYTKIYA